MADLIVKKISSPDFNPEKSVKELSQTCVGGQELQQQRQRIQLLADETNILLKKNVYQNYMQFIETAKEISHLESEMYQLSHLLTEQRVLLSSLMETSILGERSPSSTQGVGEDKEKEGGEEQSVEVTLRNKEEEGRRKLSAVLEKVEGCSSILEPPGRQLVHEGDLVEIDPVENTAIHRVHGYLLDDGFMIATWVSNRRGPVRYRFEALYDLGSLAVINVRDLGNIKHAFKLLAFPDTRVFQTPNAQSKKEWLEIFEQTKKGRVGPEPQKRESVIALERSPSRINRAASIESNNPFTEETDDSAEDLFPEWLLEAPEDLDVCIAQRHFEDALALVEKAREFLLNLPPSPQSLDVRRKVDARVKNLIDVLTSELSVSSDKSLQGGLRAARRAVRILNQLGRSTQACQLFLRLCSAILKSQLRQVKRDGATEHYARLLGGIFFSNVTDMCREFSRAFQATPACTSAFVVWSGSELHSFTSHLMRQIFVPQSSITTLANCVSKVREQCNQLTDQGLELRFQLDGALRTPLVRALADARDKLVDAVKLRAQDDKWQHLNLSNRVALNKFLQEMNDHGVASIHTYVSGECWINLTPNTITFCKLYLSLVDDCLKIVSSELLPAVDEVLCDVLKAHLKHIELSLHNEKLRSESSFIQKNAAFVVDTVLSLAERSYEEKLGHSCTALATIRNEYSWLKDGVKQRQITKYSTSGYI